MAKKTKKAEKVTSVRLYAEELERLDRIFDQAQRRNPVISQTWIIRELLGLTEVQLLTEEERAYFRSGVDPQASRPQMPEAVRRPA